MSETTTDHAASEVETHVQRRSRRLWTVVIFTYVALMGAALQMRGAVIPSLKTAFEVPESQLGLVAPVATVGFLLAVVSVGAAASRLDPKRILLVGIAGTGLGVLGMGLAPGFGVFLVALLFKGLLSGAARGLDRPVLSHLYPERRGRIFSFYDMSWAIGATSGAVLVAVALVVVDWRVAYLLVAAGFVPLVLLVWRLPTPDVEGAEQPLDWGKFRILLKRPPVVVMTVGLFVTTSIEGGLFTWLAFYAEQTYTDAALSLTVALPAMLGGQTTIGPESLAPLTLAAMVAAYIPGRFVTGWLTPKIGYRPVLGGLTLLALPVFTYTFVLAEGVWLFTGVLGIGFLISGYYPTMLAYGTETAPEYSAPINALGSAMGSAGIAGMPFIMGIVISEVGRLTLFGVDVGGGALLAMRLLIVLVVVLLVLGFVSFVVERGRPAPSDAD